MYEIHPDQIDRLMEDFAHFFDMEIKDFIRLRHQELQHSGMQNSEIYSELAREIEERRFKAPELSERQIRRIIYG